MTREEYADLLFLRVTRGNAETMQPRIGPGCELWEVTEQCGKPVAAMLLLSDDDMMPEGRSETVRVCAECRETVMHDVATAWYLGTARDVTIG